MTRRDSPDPLVPAAIGALWLLAVGVVALAAPASVRGSASLAAAVLVLVAAYWRWPKPTLLVFALAMVLENAVSRWTSANLNYFDDLMVPALVLLTLLRERPWRKGLVSPVRDTALAVFLVMGVVSSLAAAVPFNLWIEGLFLLVKVFAFLYVVLWHDFEANDVRQLYPLALATGIVVGLLSAFEFVATDTFRQLINVGEIGIPRSGLPTLSSITGHPSIYSWFMAFIGLFLFAGYVVFRRWWLLIGGALFAVGMVLSARRRAIAGMALGLIAGFLSAIRAPARPDRPRSWAIVGLTGLVIGALFISGLVGLLKLTEDEASGGSNTARVALYQTAVTIARDELPLGVGLGRYGSGLSRDPYSPVYHQYGLDTVRGLTPEFSPFVADVFWARVLGETGVIGLGALLVFCAVLALQLWRATRRAFSEPLVVAFALGAWMVFVQALVETLASSMFESPPRIYLLFGVVGAALALGRLPRPPEPNVATPDE